MAKPAAKPKTLAPDAESDVDQDELEEETQDDITGEAEGEEPEEEEEAAPPAGEEEAPVAGWGAKDWETFVHKAGSAAAHGKGLPKLPDTADVTSAPESLRPVLAAWGFITPAEGEADGESLEEPGVEVEELAPYVLQTDPQYQRRIILATRDLAEEAEIDDAIAGVNADVAGELFAEGNKLLSMLGYSVPRLAADASDADFEKAIRQLEKDLPGNIVLPTDADDPAQAMGFLISVQRHAGRHKGGPDPKAVEAAVAKARTEERDSITRWLEDQAAVSGAREKVKGGALVSAAGSKGASPGTLTAEQLEKMTPEEIADLPDEEVNAALAAEA